MQYRSGQTFWIYEARPLDFPLACRGSDGVAQGFVRSGRVRSNNLRRGSGVVCIIPDGIVSLLSWSWF